MVAKVTAPTGSICLVTLLESPAASVQTAVLGKKLVDTFPTRNPDETASPRLLSPMELSLSQERSDRLRGRSKRIGRFVHREVVGHLRQDTPATFLLQTNLGIMRWFLSVPGKRMTARLFSNRRPPESPKESGTD